MAISIQDLPRLTDEDREALDGGYVAVEGVAAPSPLSTPGTVTIAFGIAIIVVALGAMIWACRRLDEQRERRYCLECQTETDHHPKHGCLSCEWMARQW